MMDRLQALLDELKDTLSTHWEKIQEKEQFIQLKEKYEGLSPRNQKLILTSSILFAFLLLIMTPFGWFMNSKEALVNYEANQSLISNLLEVSQDVKQLPPQFQTLTSSDLRTRVNQIVSDKGISKEQISNISEVRLTNPPGSNLIPPSIEQSAVEVNLLKLTLKQVVDINYELDRISPRSKTLSLEMKASKDDPHYYDVLFKVSSFSVPEAPSENTTNPRRAQ